MQEGSNQASKAKKNKKINIVGRYIRERREALRLSQRALGLKFSPPVTTQFISNVERGVTPLPPSHVPTLTGALKIAEAELLSILEREYTAKLSGRLGVEDLPTPGKQAQILVDGSDYSLFKKIYESYRVSDEKTRLAFATVCESILKVPRRAETDQRSNQQKSPFVMIPPKGEEPIEE